MSEEGAADRALVTLLQRAQRLLIFTGAGISTNSGIPDYRGPQGIWKQRRPVTLPDFLASHAARVEYWDFKLESWGRFRDARPNDVHEAIAALERADKIEMVVTQNIDGLHLEAGSSAERVVEIHGTDRAVDCLDCGARRDPGPCYELFARTREPPRCTACGGWLKPATISFGQQLRSQDLARAMAAAQKADAVVSLGSTLAVYPAAEIPLAAARRGVPYAILNRGPTEHDGHPALTLRLEGDVSELFPPAVGRALGRGSTVVEPER